MAFYLEKQKTTSTPYVLIDEAKGYMRLEGRSFHENVAEFFKEVNDWLDLYLAQNFGTLTFDCELEYFNSSTAKLLHNIVTKMDNRAGIGKKITVNWITVDGNEIVHECGEDFQGDVHNMEFNIVVK